MTPADDERSECPHCGKDFPSRERMVRHSKNAHGKTPGGSGLRKAVLGLVLLALVAGFGLFIWQAPDAPEGRQANMEALGATDDPHLGNESAPVVVVEFGTPACPSCRHFHQNTLPTLRENHIQSGSVVYYYAQFTIGYPFDEPGGIAQKCVHRLGGSQAFFDFTDLLYRHQGSITADDLPSALRDFGRRNGIDSSALVSCYRNGETASAYEDDVSKGRANGVSGTPYFFVFGDTGEATSTGAGELFQVISETLHASQTSSTNGTGA